MERFATIALGTCKHNSASVVVKLTNTWTTKNSEQLNKAVVAIFNKLEIDPSVKVTLLSKIKNIVLFDMEENIKYNVSRAEKKLELVENLVTFKVLVKFK